jgi:hypothetical protein
MLVGNIFVMILVKFPMRCWERHVVRREEIQKFKTLMDRRGAKVRMANP